MRDDEFKCKKCLDFQEMFITKIINSSNRFFS
jgi:hypothetical protein